MKEAGSQHHPDSPRLPEGRTPLPGHPLNCSPLPSLCPASAPIHVGPPTSPALGGWVPAAHRLTLIP